MSCSNTNTNTNTNTNMKTRWCPTPEQVMILEELYRRGLKTPNATQIQRITGHLSTYGNIQGKNVFYWFQNHKARDRQKLRKKQLQLQHHLFQPHQFHYFPVNFLHPQQGTTATGSVGVCEEMGPGVAMSYWMTNCFMGPSYEGPGNNSEPLQTLELFPLRSPRENTPS